VFSVLLSRSPRITRSGGRMAQKCQFVAENGLKSASRAIPGLDLTIQAERPEQLRVFSVLSVSLW